MASKSLPSPEVLRQLLRYEPDTGKLFWRERPRHMFRDDRNYKAWNTRYAGQEAGHSSNLAGYLQIGVLGHRLMVHRVVVAIAGGLWPPFDVDHINMDRADNRISNLRPATRGENQRNRIVRSDSKSGLKGVRLHKRSGLWQARIYLSNKAKSLGYFKTAEMASLAYADASAKIHGAFGRSR